MMAMAAIAMVSAAPAMAGFALMAKGKPVAIRKSTLMVTPSIDWNRLGPKVGRNAEAWTLDGNSLNEITFYAGVMPGQPLFREVDKKNKPLPKFTASMLAPDVVAMFESSYRIAASTSLFSVDQVEPTTFLGAQGFRFRYNFTVQDEEVRRSGEATGAVIGGKLYLIAFEAPAIHYFDRDVESYRAIVASARLGAAPKK
jgi:hypothetical protein